MAKMNTNKLKKQLKTGAQAAVWFGVGYLGATALPVIIGRRSSTVAEWITAGGWKRAAVQLAAPLAVGAVLGGVAFKSRGARAAIKKAAPYMLGGVGVGVAQPFVADKIAAAIAKVDQMLPGGSSAEGPMPLRLGEAPRAVGPVPVRQYVPAPAGVGYTKPAPAGFSTMRALP